MWSVRIETWMKVQRKQPERPNSAFRFFRCNATPDVPILVLHCSIHGASNATHASCHSLVVEPMRVLDQPGDASVDIAMGGRRRRSRPSPRLPLLQPRVLRRISMHRATILATTTFPHVDSSRLGHCALPLGRSPQMSCSCVQYVAIAPSSGPVFSRRAARARWLFRSEFLSCSRSSGTVLRSCVPGGVRAARL